MHFLIRYMSGASTNPDPEVFAYKAAQVKDCMDATMRLGDKTMFYGGKRRLRNNIKYKYKKRNR